MQKFNYSVPPPSRGLGEKEVEEKLLELFNKPGEEEIAKGTFSEKVGVLGGVYLSLFSLETSIAEI